MDVGRDQLGHDLTTKYGPELMRLALGLVEGKEDQAPLVRRRLTKDDPALFAWLYFRHHLKADDGSVSLSEFHTDIVRQAQGWKARSVDPAADRDFYAAPRGAGKPVSVDALVLMGDGSRMRLGDISVGDWVITHKGRARRVTEVHIQGLQPSVRLTTRRGRELELAVDHPVLTDRGWVEAGDITTDDKIVTVPSPEVVTGKTPAIEEFALAGYFTGDGSATRSVAYRGTERPRANGLNSSMTVADPVELAHLRKVSEALGFTLTGPPPSAKYTYHVGGGARRWLERVGIAASSSYTKRVPDWVFTAPADKISAFLAAYFACDGTIGKDGRNAEYYSVNKDLLKDVQHLLHRVGVHSTLRPKKGTYDGARHDSWRLRVENVADFADAILPHLHSEKVPRLEKASAKGRFDEMDHVVAADRIDPVECRCLTVEEDHTFTANDLVVHNSTWFFLILPMWAAAHGHRMFAAAFADSATQAVGHLTTFKMELDNNELLRFDYPELCTPAIRERGTSIADRQQMYVAKSGFAFVARGIDSSTLGLKIGQRRPDLIIFDDVEPEEASYSESLATKRLKTITEGILPMSITARVVFVGTVTMYGSITHQLVRHHEQPQDWITDGNWRVHHYLPIVHDEYGNERSQWPSKWPLEYLRSIRHTTDYAKNYENRPRPMDGTWWVEKDLRVWTGETEESVRTRTIMAIDSAVTSKKKSDLTAFAVSSRLSDGRFLIEHASGRRLAHGEPMRGYARSRIEEYPAVSEVVVEANQGGDLHYEALSGIGAPIRTTHTSKAKTVRLAWLLQLCQVGKVVFAGGEATREFEEQALAYPNVKHDDILDVVCQAVEQCDDPFNFEIYG